MHYYIIGTGVEYPQATAMVKRLGLEASVTLLGEMPDPYGYLKAVDVLLIPLFFSGGSADGDRRSGKSRHTGPVDQDFLGRGNDRPPGIRLGLR